MVKWSCTTFQGNRLRGLGFRHVAFCVRQNAARSFLCTGAYGAGLEGGLPVARDSAVRALRGDSGGFRGDRALDGADRAGHEAEDVNGSADLDVRGHGGLANVQRLNQLGHVVEVLGVVKVHRHTLAEVNAVPNPEFEGLAAFNGYFGGPRRAPGHVNVITISGWRPG